MDVKDVTTVVSPSGAQRSDASPELTPQAKNSIATSANSDVSVDLSNQSEQSSLARARQAANEIVSTINVVADATGEIDRLVKSIDGIVKQASKDDVPPKRLSVLEKEANQIIDAIKRKVDLTSTSHGNPLNGDPIKLDGEPGVAPALNVQLPDHAKNAFGIKKIDFSGQAGIENSKVAVSHAQSQLHELHSKVQDTKKSVHHAVATLDVALQNTEASKATVRDLDAALKLANEAKSHISHQHGEALGSISRLGQRALDLLK